jgi:hypothetical protein
MAAKRRRRAQKEESRFWVMAIPTKPEHAGEKLAAAPYWTSLASVVPAKAVTSMPCQSAGADEGKP